MPHQTYQPGWQEHKQPDGDVHAAQEEKCQNRGVVLSQIGGPVGLDDQRAEAGNGHRNREYGDHGQVFPHNDPPQGYRGCEKHLISAGAPFIGHAAHGEDGDRDHEYHQGGVQCV